MTICHPKRHPHDRDEGTVFRIGHGDDVSDELRDHLYRFGLTAFGVELADGELVTDEGSTFCCAPGMPDFTDEERSAKNADDFDTWFKLSNASIANVRWNFQYGIYGDGQIDWASGAPCSTDGIGITIALPEDVMRRVFRDIR